MRLAPDPWPLAVAAVPESLHHLTHRIRHEAWLEQLKEQEKLDAAAEAVADKAEEAEGRAIQAGTRNERIARTRASNAASTAPQPRLSHASAVCSHRTYRTIYSLYSIET